MEDEAAWPDDEGDYEDDASEESVGEDDALHDGGGSDDALHDGGGSDDAGAEGEFHALRDGGDGGGAGAEGEVHALCDGGAALNLAQADIPCQHSSRISALLQEAELLDGQQLAAVAQVLRTPCVRSCAQASAPLPRTLPSRKRCGGS